MTSAADILDILLSRQQGKPILERRTGLPYGWGIWLRKLPPSGVAFATHDVAEVLAQRPPPVSSGRLPGMSLWQASRSLLWQGWHPAPVDQRGLRWLAAIFSLLLHLLFALLLVWVALVRTAPQPSADSEGERVEVAYIGRGTPEQEGGGTPDTGAEASAGGASAQRSERARSLTQSAADAPLLAQPVERETLVAEVAPVPQPTPAVAQPLQVTEVVEPVSEFVLPPPNTLPPRIAAPQLRTPEVQVQVRPVDILDERPPAIQLRAAEALRPQVIAPQVQVQEREIQIATPRPVLTSQLPDREVQAQLRTPEMLVREVKIPAAADSSSPVAPVPASASLPAAAATAALASNPAAKPATAAAPAAASATARGASAGAGPRPQDRAGGWDAPVRGDDWAAAKSTAAGSAGHQANTGKGLFNADGSVRVPGAGDGSAEPRRGAPGGNSDTWTRDRIADSGTWLKRPPYDYTPTSFEKYWVPNESLLAEWVRKGIKSIEIPIPGTNTRISCVVSMLQFGGGCGLSNPNMQEQPAEARPPPDIPFKQELQEDNGSG